MLKNSQAENGSSHRSEPHLSQRKQTESDTLERAKEAIPPMPPSSNGSSQRKIEANRENSKKSTGPKTPAGKAISSWNSTRHGLLSRKLPGTARQDKEQFTNLLVSLQQDLEPVGTLEELLVEKIAHEYWRLGIAASFESEELTRQYPFMTVAIDRILRYQSTINRQLYQAINQLERAQRLRKGDNVPAPLHLQVLHDSPAMLEEEEG